MNIINFLGYFLTAFCLVGFYLAYLYGRKTKKFRWSEYIAIMIWPLLSIAFLAVYVNYKIFYLFVVSMVAGTCFEYLFGLVYEKTLNKKLWKYDRLAISGYTSWLSIPIWGVAGVVFWSLGRIIGL
jgi:uncharacterized membrane protein